MTTWLLAKTSILFMLTAVAMDRYNWIRRHQHNDGLPPAVAEENLKTVSGIS